MYEQTAEVRTLRRAPEYIMRFDVKKETVKRVRPRDGLVRYINKDTHDLKTDFPRTRCYAIFRRCLKTGKLEGYVEHSFSMGWSETEVNVCRPYLWRSIPDGISRRDLAKIRNEHAMHVRNRAAKMNAVTDEYDIFATRIGSKKLSS